MENYHNYLYSKHIETIDNDAIRHSCVRMYNVIRHEIVDDGKQHYGGQATMTTKLYSKYNCLMYPFPQYYELYYAIKHMFYEIAKPTEQHYIQCWLNVYKSGEHIDWHGHWAAEKRVWHGFFCVDVEKQRSYTSYRIPGHEQIDVVSKDNLLVLGKSEDDKHRSSDWVHPEPRVTMAFDIVPAVEIHNGINHWIPI